MKTYETETTTAQDEDENEDKEDDRTLETARFEILPKCFIFQLINRAQKRRARFTSHPKRRVCFDFRSASRSPYAHKFLPIPLPIREIETPRPNSYTGG